MTGGGPPPKPLTDTEQMIISIIGEDSPSVAGVPEGREDFILSKSLHIPKFLAYQQEVIMQVGCGF